MTLSGAWPSVAFFLALFGFGAKAGLLPLHVWLPEAHPAAPSPVSALMSGVMLKTAIYGLLRVTFDLLNGQLWWWGVVALALGLVTALFGVIFAAVQTDMKRLLAYSSIENIGIIVAGIGLTILFKANGKTLLAAITLTAVLYHALNHAFFKSLLFLATGSVLHATQRAEPRQARRPHPPDAVGRVARARRHAGDRRACRRSTASSPNGCCCRRSCSRRACRNRSSTCWCRVAAAALVLAVALSAYVMVKFYGIIFLGRPREAASRVRAGCRHSRAHRARCGSRLGCVLLGIFPVTVIAVIDHVNAQLLGDDRRPQRRIGNWLLLAPISHGPLELQSADRARRDRRRRAADDRGRASGLSRPRTARAALGLRLSAADAAHAGHGRRLRAADPPGVRAVLPDRAASADAVRREAALLGHGDRSFLALALPADRARRPTPSRDSPA